MLTFDGILGLLKYAHPLRGLSFGTVGVSYVLRKGSHKPETVKALEHIVDGVIEIKSVVSRRSAGGFQKRHIREARED